MIGRYGYVSLLGLRCLLMFAIMSKTYQCRHAVVMTHNDHPHEGGSFLHDGRDNLT
jgi:hypothetical protein